MAHANDALSSPPAGQSNAHTIDGYDNRTRTRRIDRSLASRNAHILDRCQNSLHEDTTAITRTLTESEKRIFQARAAPVAWFA